MSGINNINDYSSKYNTNQEYSSLFSNASVGIQSPSSDNFSLMDYSSIKNGSYGKLLKSYYAKQDADKMNASGDTLKNLTMMKSSADALKQSSEALNDTSLWEKKTVTKKDEKTGEEITTQEYDFDAIIKAVKTFADDYNDVVEQAAKSNTKGILRNAAWMTNMTDKAKNLLSKVGISIGKGNKLEIDEELMKAADMNDLKTLFTGHNSFASKISDKAKSIGNETAKAKGNHTYTNNGTYSKILSETASDKIDKEV